MIKFKAGDKVKIRDIPEVRHWECGPDIVGKIFILSKDDAEGLNNKEYCYLEDNRYAINFEPKYFERVNKDWDE